MRKSVLILGVFILLFVRLALGDDTGPFTSLSFGNGIEFKDPEGRYQTSMRFRIQNLLQLRSRADKPLDLERAEAIVRRLRLRFFGFAYSPRLLYLIQLSFSRGDMDWNNTSYPNILRDAMIVWKPWDSFQIAFGQGKLPGNRQRVVSSGELQFVDRSIVNRQFNLDRDFGLQFAFIPKDLTVPVTAKLAFSTGDGRAAENLDAGLAYTGRFEVLPLGSFKADGDYSESDLAFEENPRLSLGLGASANHGTRRSGGQLGVPIPEPRRLYTYFADGMFKYRGLSIYAEWMKRTASNPVFRPDTFVYVGNGFNAQMGYLLNESVEVGLRYSQVRPELSVQAVAESSTQYTGVFSYYFRKHRIKLQTDLTLDETGKNMTSPVRTMILRAQMELGI